jgi:hypothetical protein
MASTSPRKERPTKEVWLEKKGGEGINNVALRKRIALLALAELLSEPGVSVATTVVAANNMRGEHAAGRVNSSEGNKR